MTPPRVFLGWDASQMCAWTVAAFTAQKFAVRRLDIARIALPELAARGLYYRETEERGAGYWDVISEAPMSTGHAIARFLVPALCGYQGWALFADGDVLFRDNVDDLFALADPSKAVQCVQHRHEPNETLKMDGQAQLRYARKNWSSVMLFNCGHPANVALDVRLVNTVPGRDLHRFCWLPDELIGTLPRRWNALVGSAGFPEDPALVHFTEGLPDMPGYESVPYADEWFKASKACGYRLPRAKDGAA